MNQPTQVYSDMVAQPAAAMGGDSFDQTGATGSSSLICRFPKRNPTKMLKLQPKPTTSMTITHRVTQSEKSRGFLKHNQLLEFKLHTTWTFELHLFL